MARIVQTSAMRPTDDGAVAALAAAAFALVSASPRKVAARSFAGIHAPLLGGLAHAVLHCGERVVAARAFAREAPSAAAGALAHRAWLDHSAGHQRIGAGAEARVVVRDASAVAAVDRAYAAAALIEWKGTSFIGGSLVIAATAIRTFGFITATQGVVVAVAGTVAGVVLRIARANNRLRVCPRAPGSAFLARTLRRELGIIALAFAAPRDGALLITPKAFAADVDPPVWFLEDNFVVVGGAGVACVSFLALYVPREVEGSVTL